MAESSFARILSTFTIAILAIGVAAVPASATNPESAKPAPPAESPQQSQPHGSKSKRLANESTCSTKGNTKVCVGFGPGSRRAASSPTPQAIGPYPQICGSSSTSGGIVFADSRLQSCRVFVDGFIRTFAEVDGVVRETGYLTLDFWDWTYASTDLANWAHQASVVARQPGSYGPPLTATVSAGFGVAGNCVKNGAETFTPTPVLPYNTFRTGEGSARTTATAIGAVGSCATSWAYIFTVPGHNPITLSQDPMTDIRCDNASGANLQKPVRVGCVVPWYAPTVNYPASRYPSLATHVAQAQLSELPGRFYQSPLYRSTDPEHERINRARACGDAPSVAGKSCDEYPLATTLNGLAFGGTRRTFNGCQINAPTNLTGPLGASACMITASENSAQGALMAAFYYDFRVLHADPFLVAPTA